MTGPMIEIAIYAGIVLLALVIIGVVNVWAALHYLIGARTLRQDLESTERLAAAT